MPRKKLGEMLVEAGVLSEQGLRMALNEQKRWGGTLGRTVVEMRLVSEGELVQVLAQQLNLPTVDLDSVDVHQTVLDLVPAELADHHCIVPFAQPMKFLDVAMADPTNLGIIDELRIRTQLNIRPYLAGPKMIERAIAKHYKRGFGRQIRRSDHVPMDTGADIPLAITGNQPRPDPAEIEAARRREGLVQAPRRPTPLEVPSSAPQGGYQPPTPIDALGVLGPPGAGHARDAEIDALQERISRLEALLERDESVLRKLLTLLVDKGIATREEILERLR
jgi:type IV pilus assembly protein PilB